MAKPAELMIIVSEDKATNDLLEELKDLTEEELAKFELEPDKPIKVKKSVKFNFKAGTQDQEKADSTRQIFSPIYLLQKDREIKKRQALKDNLSPIPAHFFDEARPRDTAKPAK